MLLDKLALPLIEDRIVTNLSLQLPNLIATYSDGTSTSINIGSAYPSTTTTPATTAATTPPVQHYVVAGYVDPAYVV